MKKKKAKRKWKTKSGKKIVLKKTRFVFNLMLFSIIIYCMYFIVFSTGFFDVSKKNITIEGTNRITNKEVLKYLDFKEGNILLINKAKLLKNVTKLPLVKEADVKKVFPDKIKIVIEERKPFAIISSNNVFYLVDNENVVLETGKSLTYTDMPFIISNKSINIKNGNRIYDADIIEMVEVLSELPKNIQDQISEISKKNNDIMLYTIQGHIVHWGDTANMKNKSEMLVKSMLFFEKSNDHISDLDLRYGNNPIIKVKESGTKN